MFGYVVVLLCFAIIGKNANEVDLANIFRYALNVQRGFHLFYAKKKIYSKFLANINILKNKIKVPSVRGVFFFLFFFLFCKWGNLFVCTDLEKKIPKISHYYFLRSC